MNWKQLFNRSTPEERLEAVALMLRVIEARREAVMIHIDLRRILLRLTSLGVLGVVTLAAAFITLHGEPALVAPALTFYIAAFLFIFTTKIRKPEPHYLRAGR